MPAKKPIEIISDSYVDRAERRIQPSLCLSLLDSLRTSEPEIPEPVELVALVTKMGPLYATFLGKLTSGASIRAAALSIGLPPGKVQFWLQTGAGDVLDELDTYCSRFMQDIQRAACVAVADAEERVFDADPTKWLSRSPTGKQFNKGQYWNEQAKLPSSDGSDQSLEDNPLEPEPVREVLERPATEDDSANEKLSEAMQVLEKTGIIKDPEFVKQAKAQFRLPGPNDQNS